MANPSWLQPEEHMQPTARDNTKTQGCSSNTSWRKPGRIKLKWLMQLRLAWMDEHPKKTQEFYQPSQVRLRTVYLGRPTVP
jgi:hypothetical protein